MSRREHAEMVSILRAHGFRHAHALATQYQSEGMGPNELEWRIKTGQLTRARPYAAANPDGGTAIVLGLLAVAVVGGALWWITKTQQPAQAAAPPAPLPPIPVPPVPAPGSATTSPGIPVPGAKGPPLPGV